MSSLREALSEALAASETGTLVEPVADAAPVEVAESAPVETAEAKAERVRDDGGRFAPKPAETPEAPVEARKPPSSWKKDYWDSWGKLDPQIQGYIEQRESEAAKGVSQYKTQYDQAAPFYQAVQPFIPHLQQRGIAPDRWLADLGHVDRILSTGSLEQKTELIQRMAAANGIDLSGMNSGQQNPQFGHIAQTVNTLQQRLQQFETQRQQEEQARLTSTISTFAADKPHFEAVRGTMGQLLQSGVASDLPTAYEKAIRLHDDIWQEAQQAKTADVDKAARMASKKVAASSPRSASPTGAMTTGNGTKSLRDTVSEAFDTAVSGRV